MRARQRRLGLGWGVPNSVRQKSLGLWAGVGIARWHPLPQLHQPPANSQRQLHADIPPSSHQEERPSFLIQQRPRMDSHGPDLVTQSLKPGGGWGPQEQQRLR